MDRERWKHIQEIFHVAVDLPAEQQNHYFQSACSGDDSMVAELHAMMEGDNPDGMLDAGLSPLAQHLLDPIPVPGLDNIVGKYRVGKLLGEGGMGVVYLASREDFGGFMAIKFLRDGLLSPDRRQRFSREQQTLAKLQHSMIAQIHDAGTQPDGTPWFVMEYVEGRPVTDYCREQSCSIEQRIRLFRLVCEAVQYAHRQTVIHRDLKPSNILVKADGTVKLVDFGIAKQLDVQQVADGEPVAQKTVLRAMTLPYASPEQVRGDNVGTQTDVYSLGILLYELLCGQLPFDFSDCSRAEAEKLILETLPDPPSRKRDKSALPSAARIGKLQWSELDVLCLTAIHKDVQRRYPSCEALIRDIDHYLKGEPLEARPDSLSYRLDKFVRRNRRVLIASVAVSATFIALVVFFVVRLASARTAAVEEARRTQRMERFMLNLFDGGDKAAGPSDNLRVVTLLDSGVRNARTLNAEPVVQADLNQTLGGIYQKLGKLDQAERLMRTSLEQRTSISGSDSPAVAGILVAMGSLRVDQGQLPEAERLVREGLAMHRRHLPSNDPAIGKDLTVLGRVLEERGQYDDAIKTLNEAVMHQSAKPEATTDLSDSIDELANAQYYEGHLSASDSLHKQALAMDQRLFGSIHPRVADDYYGLGLVQHEIGHEREAEQYYRKALSIKQSWYGNDHPDTALIMAAVGQALSYQGRYDEAAPLLQEALAIQERLFGKVHPRVAMSLNVLGLLELRRGHLPEAEKDFIRMADINRAVYGDRHMLVGVALLNLGSLYMEEKQLSRAESSLRDALSQFLEKLPAGHSYTSIAQVQLGHALLLEHRYEESEAHLLAGYYAMAKDPSSQAKRIQTARKDLAAVYMSLNQPDRAKPFESEMASGAAH